MLPCSSPTRFCLMIIGLLLLIQFGRVMYFKNTPFSHTLIASRWFYETKKNDALSDLQNFKDVLFHDEFQKIKEIKDRMNNGSFTIPKKVPTFLIYALTNVMRTYWNRQMLDITNNRCILPCNFTKNIKDHKSVDAIVIFIRDIKNVSTLYKNLRPRNPKQPWIFYSTEHHILANSRYYADYHQFNGVFNRTMYYRRDSDIRTHHGFVVPRSEAEQYLPKGWRMPVNTEYSLASTKTMAAAMITNCKDKSGRLKYITELNKYVDIDIYGKCGKLNCSTPNYVDKTYYVNTDKCLHNVGTNYYFYLAFENALCFDYITEKIYNILYFPVIPVVLGGSIYSDFLPPNSYIDAGNIAPKQLADLMHRLISNPKEYFSYFEWKKYYTPSTLGTVRILCDLCVKLHDENFYKHNVVEDFYDWMVTKSHCVNGNDHPPWLNH